MIYVDYPHLLGSTSTEEKIKSLEKYLFRTADVLNYNLGQATPEKVFEQAAKAVQGASSPAAEPGERANYTALRDLIIKSAGSVVQTGGSFTFSLDGEYVALSEFGEFKKATNLAINANSEDVTALFKKNEKIETDVTNYKSEMKNYISAGYDGDVFALDIGLLKNELSVGNEKVEVATPRKIRITPKKLSFYEGTNEVAYMAEEAIWFPKANITGGTIDIANSTFNVAADGSLTATKANITGDIVAKSLTLAPEATIPSTAVSGMDNYAKSADVNKTLGSYAKSADVDNKLKIYVKQGEAIGANPSAGATGISISTEGLLQASNAVIWGKIYATDGEFTGKVTAAEGQIASWKIGNSLKYPNDSVIYKSDTIEGVGYEVGLKATFGSLKYANYYVAREIENKWKNVLWINNEGELASDDGTARTIVGSGQINFLTNVSGSLKQYGIIKAANDGNVSLTNPMLCIQSHATNSAGVCVSAASDAWYIMYRDNQAGTMSNSIRHSFYGDTLFKNMLMSNDSIYTAKNFIIYKNHQFLYGKTTSGTSQRLIGVSNKNNVVVGNTDLDGNLSIYAPTSKQITLSAGTVKANTTTLATGSDARIKNDISDINEKYTEFFKRLRPVTYKYNNGNSGRNHVGFVAQEVLQALEQSGLTSQDFAGYVRAESDEPNLDGYELLIRYSEFTALNTFMIQQLIAENKRIKKELLLLKTERMA